MVTLMAVSCIFDERTAVRRCLMTACHGPYRRLPPGRLDGPAIRATRSLVIYARAVVEFAPGKTDPPIEQYGVSMAADATDWPRTGWLR